LYSALERVLERLSIGLALVGGVVLVALVVITVVSVTGRALISVGLGPIPGDFELIEAGTGFAIFAFLPWCQMRRGHVTVDILMARLSTRTNLIIDIVANVLMTAAAGLVLWRLYLGMLDKMSYGETTFILQFPVWWPYSAALVGATVFVLVCAFTVVRSVHEFALQPHGRSLRE